MAVNPSGTAAPGAVDSNDTSLDCLEIAFLAVFAAFVAASWASFTLAEIGLDRPLAVLVAGLCGLAVLGIRLRRGAWRPPGRSSLIGLLVPVALGIALFFPPDEWILGALDPGSYVSAGASIAKTGRIVVADSLLLSLDPSIREALYPFPASRLPGFYLPTLDFGGVVPRGFVDSPSQVTPHGFHLFPVVLAFGYAMGGIWTELAVTPILALGGLVAVYLLWRRLFGTAVAGGAACLLVISPAEVWFARYPAAEILSQLLLFGGLLAFVLTIETPRRSTAFVAGLAFGAIHLTKIEAIPLPFAVASFIAYEAVVGRFRREWLWFLLPYGLLLSQAVAHALLISSWYTASSFGNTFSSRNLALIAGSVIASVVVLAVLIASPEARHLVRTVVRLSIWEKPVAVLGPSIIGIAFAYGYFIRPLTVVASPASRLDPGQVALMNDAQSFVRLGWYVGSAGLLFGSLGWMWLAAGERRRRAALPLLLLAIDTFLYLDHMHITPVHYWAARRWIPVVIPGFSMASAYFLVRLFPSNRARFTRAFVPIGLALVMAAELFQGTRPLLGYVEYRGAVSQMALLADVIPPGAMVLFPEGDSGERLSTPVQYIFDRPSIVIYPTTEAQAAARRLVRGYLDRGVAVYWVSTPQVPAPAAVGMSGTLVASQHLSLPEKIVTRDTRPGADGVFQQDLEIWKLGPVGE